jgi:RNA polymerase sigma-70 factor (ECF subfamily)
MKPRESYRPVNGPAAMAVFHAVGARLSARAGSILDASRWLRQRGGVAGAGEAPDSSDLRCVEAARRGDGGAFESLYRRYGAMVHGILLARVPRYDVEDLVQEVFLAVFRRIASLKDAAAFPGWLAMIARNRATDYLRKEPRAEELPEDLASEDRSETEARSILDLVRSLPEAYRETLVLRLVAGMTGPEIAARTGLTPGSVRVNLHRGMAQLRELLARRKSHG